MGPLAGLATILVITVPTMVVAEDWHGRPMIDDAGWWWLLPGAVAVSGFFAGGAVYVRVGTQVSSRGAGRPAWSTVVGALLGAVAAGLLVGADGVRRLLVNPTLPIAVVEYWVEAAAVGIALSALGALTTFVTCRRDLPATR